MFLKFKVRYDSELSTEEWKVYECRNYAYRTFTFDKIIDFLISDQFDDDSSVPKWIIEADLKVLPEISKELATKNRIVSEHHTHLLATKCIHFQITPITSNDIVNVITIKDVYVLGDKGQTVDRIIPNNSFR